MAKDVSPADSDQAPQHRLWSFAARDAAIAAALAAALEDEDVSVAVCAMRCLCHVEPARARQFLAKSSTRHRIMAAGHKADAIAAFMNEIAEAEARSTREVKCDPWRFECIDEYDAAEYEGYGDRAELTPVLLSALDGRLVPEDLGLTLVQAIEALGHTGHPAAVKPLLRQIQTQPEPVQAAALRAIGDLGNCSAQAALEAMAPTLPEQIHSSVQYARDSLARARTYAEHAAETLSNAARVDSRPAEAADTIARLTATGYPEAVDCARPLMRHAAAEVRLAAVRALGCMRARRSCRALLRLAAEEDQPLELRVAAIRAAGKTRRKQDAADVGQFLASREEPLRAAAVKAMGNLQGKRSVRALVKGAMANTFKLHAPENAHLPAKAMTKIGDRYAISIAESALASSRPEKRARAAVLLGHVIGPHAVEALVGACSDQHPAVRKAALRSLMEQTTYRLV